MFHYKAILEYDGSSYFGWQVQKDEVTVQSKLQKALEEMAKSDNVRTLASSRTDRGVHATGQTVKISLPFEIETDGLKKGLNSLLPEDIRVRTVENSNEAFHPISDAQWKEYRYRFTNLEQAFVLQKNQIANISFELDIYKMQQAAEAFVGEHDFCNYFVTGTEVNSTVRTIYDCRIDFVESNEPTLYPSHYVLVIKGSGFLKQMVRLIMGTLWNAGRGKVSVSDIQDSFTEKKQKKLGAVAPAEGLTLVKVSYQTY